MAFNNTITDLLKNLREHKKDKLEKFAQEELMKNDNQIKMTKDKYTTLIAEAGNSNSQHSRNIIKFFKKIKNKVEGQDFIDNYTRTLTSFEIANAELDMVMGHVNTAKKKFDDEYKNLFILRNKLKVLLEVNGGTHNPDDGFAIRGLGGDPKDFFNQIKNELKAIAANTLDRVNIWETLNNKATKDDFLSAYKQIIETNATSLDDVKTYLTNLTNEGSIITLKTTIETMKNEYTTAFKAFEIVNVEVEAIYTKIMKMVDRFRFVATGEVETSKTLEEAAAKFHTTMLEIDTTTNNSNLTKYQMVDKLTSLQKELEEKLERNYDKDDFLAESRLCGIDATGKECMDILNQCLSGKDSMECLARWNKMKFSQGIKFEEGDIGTAKKLGKKLGFDISTVTVTSLEKEFKDRTGDPLHSHVTKVIQAIYSIYHNKSPQIPQNSVVYMRPVQVLHVLRPSFGGKMTGGGSTVSYSDFIRGFDSLKNNIHMSGGDTSPNTAAAFRNNYNQLKNILNSNGKTLEETDDKRMQEVINSIERSEKRVGKFVDYISILNTYMSSPEGKALLATEGTASGITLELLETFTQKLKATSSALSGKVNTFFNSYSSLVHTPLIMELIKNTPALTELLKNAKEFAEYKENKENKKTS